MGQWRAQRKVLPKPKRKMVKRRLMKKMYLLRICQTALSVTDVFKYVDLEIFTIFWRRFVNYVATNLELSWCCISRTGTGVVAIDSIMSVPSLSAMRKIIFIYIYLYHYYLYLSQYLPVLIYLWIVSSLIVDTQLLLHNIQFIGSHTHLTLSVARWTSYMPVKLMWDEESHHMPCWELPSSREM